MTSPSYDDPFLTVEDVAAIFAVEQTTVREWLRKNKLRGVKPNNGPWRVLQSEVKRFANERNG